MASGSRVRPWSVQLWGYHLLGLLCVGFAISMGVWQYNAYEERRAAEQQDLTTSAPVPMTDLIGPDDPFPRIGLGRPVEVRGTFLPEGTVLVADREGADGAEGRWLVTPMSVGEPGQPAVAVVRGWVPTDTDPATLPAPPTGPIDVLGWLQPTEGGNVVDDDPSDTVVPLLRVADVLQRLDRDQDMYGAYVLAQDPLPTDAEAGIVAGTLDQLPPASRFTGLRNVLYAVEWWVFTAFALYIWFRFVRDTVRAPGVRGATGKDPDEESDDEGAGGDAVPSQT